MVNPGHPSRGCGTCRTRRIKCDEAYPACSRCTKSKRVCLGYSIPKQSIVRSRHQLRPQESSHHSNLMNNSYGERGALHRVSSTCPGDLGFLGRLPILWSLDQVAALTMETTAEGLQSLQSPSQSMQLRSSMHLKYGLAIHQLRKSLLAHQYAQVLFVPALLFSFYEVTFNTSGIQGNAHAK
jgi:hypothetical protein